MFDEVNQFLNENKEENYKEFSKKLTSTKYEIYGVRIPKLRKYACKIYKEKNYLEFLKTKSNIFEINMLKGMVVAYTKDIELIDNFVKIIDDWSICDTTHWKSKDEKFYNKCLDFLESDQEFICRWGIVNLLFNFLDEKHIDNIVLKIQKVKSDKYYVKMAIAWLIQKLYFIDSKKAEDLLCNIKDEDVKKMAKQKIRDSLRERKG